MSNGQEFTLCPEKLLACSFRSTEELITCVPRSMSEPAAPSAAAAAAIALMPALPEATAPTAAMPARTPAAVPLTMVARPCAFGVPAKRCNGLLCNGAGAIAHTRHHQDQRHKCFHARIPLTLCRLCKGNLPRCHAGSSDVT